MVPARILYGGLPGGDEERKAPTLSGMLGIILVQLLWSWFLIKLMLFLCLHLLFVSIDALDLREMKWLVK